MRGDAREWSVPEPFRALMWWPAVSFVLVVALPDAAVWSIIVAGFVLALAGALIPAVARTVRREPAADRPVVEVVEISEVEAAA